MIIAVDFDGTCVEHEYPRIGAEARGVVPWLHLWVDAGARLILWTIRSGVELEQAIGWFRERGIPLWGVNQNPEQAAWSGSRKAYAHLYVDDAAFGCPVVASSKPEGRPVVDWQVIGPEVLELLENGDGVARSPKIVMADV